MPHGFSHMRGVVQKSFYILTVLSIPRHITFAETCTARKHSETSVISWKDSESEDLARLLKVYMLIIIRRIQLY